MGTGGIQTAINIIKFVVFVLDYVPLIKNIKNGIKAVAEIVVEIFVELIATIGKAIIKLICKFVPYFGFFLQFALELLIDVLILPAIFDQSRMKKIKNTFSKKVGKSTNFKYWINSFGYSLKKCF